MPEQDSINQGETGDDSDLSQATSGYESVATGDNKYVYNVLMLNTTWMYMYKACETLIYT